METATEAAAAAEIQKMPDWFKEGLEIYESLRKDMEKALGLKEYAEHMFHISQTLKEINQHLDETERDIMDKLKEAHRYSLEGMDKATVVVSVIKEQCSSLVLVLSDAGPGADHEKMWAACQYFSGFAIEAEKKVEEAEESLRNATQMLLETKADLRSIIDTLERVQNNFIAEMKAAQASARVGAYVGALAGLILGPIGLIISYSVAAGVTEGMTIPQIEENFRNQRKKMSEYIDGFERMYSETTELEEELKVKRQQLVGIHGKLSNTGSLAGNTAVRSIPLIHFNVVRRSAEALVTACDEFLSTEQ